LFGAGNIDLARRFPSDLLGLFRRIRVDWRLSLIGLSPCAAATGSCGRVFGRPSTKIIGQNWDGGNWDVTVKSRNR
jgi:hypothetical protein